MTCSFLRGLSSAALLVAVLAGGAEGQTPLKVERIATGFSNPLYLTSPPDDDRLFVVEQRGAIKIIENGTVLPTPFIDFGNKVSQTSNERGLLGLAFHPDYATNGFFYVNYTSTANAHGTIVERYSVSGDPNVADPNSGVVILGPIAQPFSNHNGGCIQFGPDGKLYVGTGDGGSAGDPSCNAQNGNTLLGKMLRLNDDGSIPVDNPFTAAGDGILDQIWATGLRNPWRFSFDRETGDLYIADVGQNSREEVSFAPGTSTGGENYGWKVMEGNQCFSTSACTPPPPPCDDPAYTDPFRVYGHGGGNCSITGGYVYRGDAIPDLAGKYWHADYCSARVWALRYDGAGGFTDNVLYTSDPDFSGAFTINLVTSFGEDAHGEVYIVDQGGEIFKIVPRGDFVGLGSAFPGVNGKPVLWGEGGLGAGQPGALHLQNAAPSRLAALFFGASQGAVPFNGGTLVPFPFVNPPLLVFTDANGEILAPWTDLGSNPSGLSIYLQFAVDDPAAAFGTSLSNALRGTIP